MYTPQFFFLKKARLKIRFIHKGYKTLKKTNQLDFLKKLNDLLARTKLMNTHFSKTIQTTHLNFELSARQYLYTRILEKPFNEAVLLSIGSGKNLKYPLPKEWRIRLEEEGVKIDKLACSFLWVGYILKLWVINVIKGVISFFKLFRGYKDLKKYVYFDHIAENSLPSNDKVYTIVNWYLQWKNNIKKINSIVHSDESVTDYKYKNLNIFFSDGLPQIKGFKLVKYILWSLYLCFYSLLFIVNKPYSSILLFEQLKLIRVKLSSKENIVSDALFNNTNAFYRPLWTYEAKKMGARILFYFYSTNIENFKTENGYSTQNPWHIATWPYFLIWDDFQKRFLERNEQFEAIKEKVGIIWYSSTCKKLDIQKNAIAVFDITPYRLSHYFWRIKEPEYYIFNIIDLFLSDIQNVLSRNNFCMLHKMKRVNKFADKRYVGGIKKLNTRLNYIEVDPNMDALHVIKKTMACISLPFTSTALIAKEEGKPSVYYDPTGTLQIDDRAAHGILILRGIGELNEWVNDLENKPKTACLKSFEN